MPSQQRMSAARGFPCQGSRGSSRRSAFPDPAVAVTAAFSAGWADSVPGTLTGNPPDVDALRGSCQDQARNHPACGHIVAAAQAQLAATCDSGRSWHRAASRDPSVHGAWQPWELRADRPDRWDANVNGWLNGNDLAGYPPDGRKFLVRLFQAAGDGLGVARAVLSDSYNVIDNLDALMATLHGIRPA